MKSAFRSLQVLTETELEKLDTLITIKQIKKGEHLIQQGDISDEIFFVRSGVLRLFYINETGEDSTTCLTFENEFLSAYVSFITQQPSEEGIQAVCDSEVWILNRADMNLLYSSSASWQQVGRIIAEAQYVELARRVHSLQKHSAKERYDELLQKHPKYLQAIPQHQLASYLGITPRHLTRIRRQQ